MKVYVLGAGASLHAGYPLAANLGDALVAWNSKNSSMASERYGSTLAQLHTLYGGLKNLEKILDEVTTSQHGSPAYSLSEEERKRISGDLRHQVQAYFRSLRESPAPCYAALARQFVRGGDVVITFNYDTAVERQLKLAGLWEAGDGYGFDLESAAIPKSLTSVLKLHGSANWLEVLFGGISGLQQVGSTFGERPIIMPGELEFLGYPLGTRDRLAPLGPAGALPAIIAPMREKQFYEKTSFGLELAGFWDQLWERASSALRSAQNVVVIGYSMPSADERATTLLLGETNLTAEIEAYCGQDAGAVANKFAAAGYRNAKAGRGTFFENYLTTAHTQEVDLNNTSNRTQKAANSGA